MFIECLQRELAICPHAEVEDFLARDPGRWHVISIREPNHPEAVLTHAKAAHAVIFEDVLNADGNHGQGPKPVHLQHILRFVERSAREPLLFQCWAGRSRSTAVALVVIVKSLWDQGLDGAALVRTAIDVLLTLRPITIPNRLVLRLGLDQILPPPLGQTLSKALMEEPRIRRNFA